MIKNKLIIYFFLTTLSLIQATNNIIISNNFSSNKISNLPDNFKPPVLVSEIDKITVFVGDQIKYKIKLTYKKGLNIVQKPGFLENLGKFEVTDYNRLPVEYKGDTVIEQVIYKIVIFQTGKFTIPPVELQFKVNNVIYKIATNPIDIFVKEISPEMALTNDIKDIKPPLEIKGNYLRLYLFLGIILFVLLVGFVLFYFLKIRKNKKEIIIPRYDEALQSLEQLNKKQYIQSEKWREFYFEFTDIIKKYLDRRYNKKFTVMLTKEIITTLETLKIEKEFFEFYTDILKYSDFIKFAKKPSNEDKTNFYFNYFKNIVIKDKQESEKQEQLQDENNNDNMKNNKNDKSVNENNPTEKKTNNNDDDNNENQLIAVDKDKQNV